MSTSSSTPRPNRHGISPSKRGTPKADRFARYVEITTDGCHLWLGHIAADTGYGTFRLDGNNREKAHRFAYAAAYGPIPEGLQVDHICWVRHCVNPEHLQLVTQQQNLMLAHVRRGDAPADYYECLLQAGLAVYMDDIPFIKGHRPRGPWPWSFND